MAIEKKLEDGKLVIERAGAIYRDIGTLRGINPLNSIYVEDKLTNRTLVKYGSTSGRDPDGKFIFYRILPEDIEGWLFAFKEIYPAGKEEGIPVEQELNAYTMNGKNRTYNFSRKKHGELLIELNM